MPEMFTYTNGISLYTMRSKSQWLCSVATNACMLQGAALRGARAQAVVGRVGGGARSYLETRPASI